MAAFDPPIPIRKLREPTKRTTWPVRRWRCRLVPRPDPGCSSGTGFQTRLPTVRSSAMRAAKAPQVRQDERGHRSRPTAEGSESPRRHEKGGFCRYPPECLAFWSAASVTVPPRFHTASARRWRTLCGTSRGDTWISHVKNPAPRGGSLSADSASAGSGCVGCATGGPTPENLADIRAGSGGLDILVNTAGITDAEDGLPTISAPVAARRLEKAGRLFLKRCNHGAWAPL